MNQELSKKQQTRLRIVDAASQGFRSHGYAGIGVDSIAKAAEVTSGAFYSHFGSKDGAFTAAIDAGLDEVLNALPIFQQRDGQHWVESFVSYYLGKPHRQDLANGCAMTSLSPEIVRSNIEQKKLYEKKMKEIVQLITEGLEGGTTENRLSRAWSFISTLIGGLTLSRAVKSKNTAEEIAQSVKLASITIAGEVKAKND